MKNHSHSTDSFAGFEKFTKKKSATAKKVNKANKTVRGTKMVEYYLD